MSNKDILLSKPSKNPEPKITWKREDEIIVISYPKEFGKIEKWFHNRIGGPDLVRRPLDKYTTLIWELCDGKNTVIEIIDLFDAQFGEEVAPASSRVQLFLEKLLELNLIILK